MEVIRQHEDIHDCVCSCCKVSCIQLHRSREGTVAYVTATSTVDEFLCLGAADEL